MKIRELGFIGACVFGLLAACGSAGASEVLYDNSGFLTGQQSFSQSFQISGPGTLTVSLANVAWPEQLASLDMLLSTTNGLLGPEMGAGTETFDIKAGGTLFADWFGTAQGPLDAGVFSMNIQFQPSGVTPVPLPYSLGLLGSALLLLVWHRRRPEALAGAPSA
jgi:hypothetical protein